MTDPGLYVGRPVLNTQQLREWAKSQGLPELDKDLHLTQLYSPASVPWQADLDHVHALPTKTGGLGVEGGQVVFVSCPECETRHAAAMAAGAQDTHEGVYKPHVTLFYDKDWGDKPIPKPPFTFVLGPEQTGTLAADVAFPDPDHQQVGIDTAEYEKGADGATEHAQLAKYNHNHSPKTGEFTGATGEGQGHTQDAHGIWRTSTGAKTPARIAARMKELAVPPSWKDVRVNPDREGHLQAVGKDSKGRTVRKYSKAFMEGQSAAKYERLKAFNKALPGLRRAISADLKGPEGKRKETAAVLRLIDLTGFRVGSHAETGADKQAYGASTLLAKHLSISGNKLTFNFVGKKGVQINHQVESPELARFLAPRKAAGGDLFHTDAAAVRQYVKQNAGPGFKTKDMRTWNATNLALRLVSGMKPVTSDREFSAARMSVAKQVAAHLGNTPNMAIKSYIEPTVWATLRGHRG